MALTLLDLFGCLPDPSFVMKCDGILSVDLFLVVPEFLHSDGGPFGLLCQNGASFKLCSLLCFVFERNLKSAHYYVLTDSAFLFESLALRNSFFDFTGSLPCCQFVLDRFPGSELKERSRRLFAGYLFTVHWNHSFRSTFFVPFYYMGRCQILLKKLRTLNTFVFQVFVQPLWLFVFL